LENDIVRRTIASLPPNCAIVHLRRAGLRVLELPTYHGHRIGDDIPDVRIDDATRLDGAIAAWSCARYYRGSLCSTPDGASTCRRIEETMRLESEGAWTLPARPSMTNLAYPTDTLRVEMFRVTSTNGAEPIAP
jgi:hypothetical protein